MSVGLNDLAQTGMTAYQKKVIKDVARESDLLAMIPITPIPGLKVEATRWNALPTAGKRALNGSYTESTGRVEKVAETLHIYGAEAKVDRVAAHVKSDFADQLSLQTEMMKMALKYSVHYDFILGNHGVDPNGLEGLVTRVTNGVSKYDVNVETGGASRDILSTTANSKYFLSALHAGKKYLGGRVDAIFCNESTFLGIGQTLRNLGVENLLGTKEQYEREWNTFLGAKIVDVGYTSYANTTEIITNTQGIDSLGSSLFMVRMGDDEGLNMITLAGESPAPYDPLKGGELSTQPAYIRRIDWPIGLKNMSRNFSIVRIKGFKAFSF